MEEIDSGAERDLGLLHGGCYFIFKIKDKEER